MYSFTIRTAQTADIPELVRLRLAYFDEEFGELPEQTVRQISEQLPEYFRSHLGRDCVVYAAELPDGTFAGCAILTIQEKPANPFFPTGRCGYVLGVYVMPEYRGARAGTWLMKMLLIDAKRRDLDFVSLSASDMGLGLYARLGFRPIRSRFTEMEYVLREGAGHEQI